VKLSARNILPGTVASVKKGAVNAEVILNLKGGPVIAAIITNSSADNLGLKEGVEAFAIIKASTIIVEMDLPGKVCGRNIINGTVTSVVDGPASAEVGVDIGAGNVLTAVITESSAKKMELKTGSNVSLIINESGIILGV